MKKKCALVIAIRAVVNVKQLAPSFVMTALMTTTLGMESVKKTGTMRCSTLMVAIVAFIQLIVNLVLATAVFAMRLC